MNAYIVVGHIGIDEFTIIAVFSDKVEARKCQQHHQGGEYVAVSLSTEPLLTTFEA